MKQIIILSALALFIFTAFIQMNVSVSTIRSVDPNTLEEYKFPKKVMAVIDKSCYGCHSAKGRSDKAKDALRWDMLHEYDKAKLVAAMEEIIEVVEKQEMPPKKFLENKPDAKPTDKEYETLSKWADKEAEKLMK